MLAALLYGKEDLRLEIVPDPTPDLGEVVIRVKTATTCGTNLKVWRRGGHGKMLQLPTLFGHEAAGEIVAMGEGVQGWQIGSRVVANNSAPCFRCFFCDRHAYSLCPNITWNNGTFAEYLKIPAAIIRANLLLIPLDVPDKLALLTELLAYILHGIDRSPIQSKDRVIVIGDGAIGLMFVAVLATRCAEVMLFGGNDNRLKIGRQFGAFQTFNYHQLEQPIPEVVRSLLEGWGADAVIEATGVPEVCETAIACGRPGAIINLFWGCRKDTKIKVNPERLHDIEMTLKGVFHSTPYHVREALSTIASRQISLELLLSDRRSLKDLERTFQDMRDRQVIKVAIVPGA